MDQIDNMPKADLELGDSRCFVYDGEFSICQGGNIYTLNTDEINEAQFVQKRLYLFASKFNLEIRCSLDEARLFATATGLKGQFHDV